MNRRGVHILKWDGHLENLNGLFQKLYTENNMVDVTIACREGSIKAHKLVLTACSPFFERVLLENPCKHPVLIMRGVTLNDMQKLTAFMYKGTLEVQQDDILPLLKTGEDLEIRGIKEIKVPIWKKRKSDEVGLTEVPDHLRRDTRYKGKKRVAVDHSPLRDSSPEPTNKSQKTELKREPVRLKITTKYIEIAPKKPDDATKKGDANKTADAAKPVQETPVPIVDATTDVEVDPLSTVPLETINLDDSNPKVPDGNDDDYDEEEDPSVVLQDDPKNLLITEKTLLPCSVCCKPFEREEDLQAHVRNVHLQASTPKKYQCDMCSISFNRSSHLERHRRTHTGERPFHCTLCEKDFSRQDKLRQHLRNSHCESSSNDAKPETEEEPGKTDVTVESDRKKRRGRPRKYPLKVVNPFTEKRKRGRPRKPVTESDGLRTGENYDLTSLPYGDFSYLMMPPHDSEFSIVEPVVEIVSEQTNVLPPENSSPVVAPIGSNSDSVGESSLVDSVRQIGECTIRVVPPAPIPCTLIV